MHPPEDGKLLQNMRFCGWMGLFLERSALLMLSPAILSTIERPRVLRPIVLWRRWPVSIGLRSRHRTMEQFAMLDPEAAHRDVF